MEVKQSAFTICGNYSWVQGLVHSLRALFLMLSLFGIGPALSAQQILIREDQVLEDLRREGFKEIEIVNGQFSYASTDKADRSELQPFIGFMLAVLAHDQMEAGQYSRRTPLYDLLPDLIEENPFEVPVRVEDLLISSSGYATPPNGLLQSYKGPVARLLLRQRTPGRISYSDPVGQLLMRLVLERTSKKSLADLINDRFLAPFELARDSIHLGDTTLISGTLSRASRTRLLHLLLRPEDLSQGPRLSYHDLLFEDPFLTTFLGNGYATLGLTVTPIKKADMIISKGDNSCLLAFRSAGLAFWFGSENACHYPYPGAVQKLARDQVIDRNARARLQALANNRQQAGSPIRFTGRYIEDTAPRADLASKLAGFSKDPLMVKALPDGRHLFSLGDETTGLTPTAPYTFVDRAGDQASFSPYRRGGYLLWRGTVYREVGTLGNADYLYAPVPFLLLIMMTAGLYWREKTSGEWRRLAKLGAFASLLTLSGVALEVTYWQWALYDLEPPIGPWLILAWRIGLNIGLALAVAVTVLALIISRKAYYPTGAKALIAPLHLLALAGSGIGLFVILTAWGIAGELWPY